MYVRENTMEPTQELDIKKYLQLLYKKRYVFAASVISILTITIIVSYVLPKEYEAKSTIFIEKNFMNDLIKGIIVTQSIEERTKALSTVLKSRSFLLRVLKDLDIDTGKYREEQREGMIRNLQQKTEIKIELNREHAKDTDLFTVTFRGRDPQRSRDYVNALVRRYIQENVLMNKEESFGATRFLSDQIALFKQKLDRADSEIEDLKKNKDVMFEERLSSLERKLNELLVVYTDEHPDVKKVKSEIELLKHEINRKHSEITTASAGKPQDEGLQPALRKKQSADAGVGRKTLIALEQERESLKKTYEELLASRSKSEVSTQIEVQDKSGVFKILDHAITPLAPVSPNRINIILFGILGGLAAGLGIVILADLYDTRIKSIATVKTLGLPVLAIIPIIQNKKEIWKRRRRDTLFYAATSIYALGVIAILAIEFMGLPYVDDFSQIAVKELKGSFDSIFYHPGVRRPRE